MSVTFSPAWHPGDPAIELPELPGWDATPEAWDAWHDAVEAAEGPRVNVSNTNAVHLLGLLGLTGDGTALADREADPLAVPEVELVGEADAGDFLGRVLIALAVNPADAGTATISSGGPGTGTALMVDCGRRAGYSEDRLGELRTVAEAARAAGRTVAWS
jgi:hypothetical protein